MSNIHDKKWFKENRREQYDYCLKIKKLTIENNLDSDNKKKIYVIPAPVKSGKKDLVECFSQLEARENCKHIFVSAWNRVADQDQHKELKDYNIDVFMLNNLKNKDICINKIYKYINNGKYLYIHLDELDYGAEQGQILDGFINDEKIINYENCILRLYSATFEITQVNLKTNSYKSKIHICDKFIPHSSYYGIKNYLNDNKIKEAETFFNIDFYTDDIDFSEQGLECYNSMSSEKWLGIVRICGRINNPIKESNCMEFDEVKELSPKLEEKYPDLAFHFVGSLSKKNNKIIQWDNERYWDKPKDFNPNLKNIIIVQQTANRSTQFKCHPYLAFYHTKRGDSTANNTICQDEERVVYYKDERNSNVDIMLYGNITCAKYSAGELTLDEFNKLSGGRKLDKNCKMKKTTHGRVNLEVKVYKNWDEIPQEITKTRRIETYITDTKRFNKENFPLNYEGREMYTNCYLSYRRDRITNWQKKEQKQNAKAPIEFVEDSLNVKTSTGISEKNPIRIAVAYKKSEIVNGCIDSENYYFIVTKLLCYDQHYLNYVDNSMYDTLK